MHKKLAEIIKKTKEDLIKRKQRVSINVILNSVQDLKKIPKQVRHDSLFKGAILSPKNGSVAIIAEVKLASPNEGVLGDKDEIETRVKQYEQAGADALSVVTERHFFKGTPIFIKRIKDVTSLPILQKDFIIDPYQLYEVRLTGADAILLIAKILSEKDLITLVNLSIKLGIEPVVEINDQNDLKKALVSKTKIIATNARNLDNFKVDVDYACKLLKQIPNKFIKLGFSGIHSRVEVEKYKQAGTQGVLVGTALMKARNIKQFVSSLRGEKT